MTTKHPFNPRRLLPAGGAGWLSRHPRFTGEEVRRLLTADTAEARARAVARCAARVDAWLPPEPHFSACPQHAWQHLPRIVFWYTCGESLATIAGRIGTLGPAWGVERALALACARMADCLNRDPLAYGLPRAGRAAHAAQRWGRH